MKPATPRPFVLLAAVLLRAAGLAVVWWAVSGGRWSSWPFGLAACLAGAAASVALSPPPWPRPRLGALLAFIPYFIAESLRGGMDVARRAFSPRLPLAPALLTYEVTGMGRAERLLFLLAVNLFPGTLSARLDGDVLHVHALDAHGPVEASLRRLDERLGTMFARGEARP